MEDKRVIERRFDGIEVWGAEMRPSGTDCQGISALLYILAILPCSAGWAVALLKRRPFVFELRDIWPDSLEAVGAAKNLQTY